MVKYECTNENEFKILIRAIIIGFLMISDYSEIILGANEYVERILHEFIKNLSKRRKIDNEFYIELLYIE